MDRLHVKEKIKEKFPRREINSKEDLDFLFSLAKDSGRLDFSGLTVKVPVVFNDYILQYQPDGTLHFPYSIYAYDAIFLDKFCAKPASSSVKHVFLEGISISDCNFVGEVNFSGCIFNEKFRMEACLFEEHYKPDFSAVFKKLCDFSGSIFLRRTYFSSKFNDLAIFARVVFDYDVKFGGSHFMKDAVFNEASFFCSCSDGTLFNNVVFENKALFISTKLQGKVDFNGAIFKYGLNLSGACWEPENQDGHRLFPLRRNDGSLIESPTAEDMQNFIFENSKIETSSICVDGFDHRDSVVASYRQTIFEDYLLVEMRAKYERLETLPSVI
jgi:hypothetical protein